jgi:hypothetical protein
MPRKKKCMKNFGEEPCGKKPLEWLNMKKDNNNNNNNNNNNKMNMKSFEIWRWMDLG